MKNFHPFPYLEATARRYGVDDLRVVKMKDSIIQRLNAKDFARLAETYELIVAKGHTERLSEWATEIKNDEYCEDRRHALMLLFLFKDLADRSIVPFTSRLVRIFEKAVALDWTKLPDGLHFLIDPAVRYRAMRFIEAIEAFMANVPQEELDGLRVLQQEIEKNQQMIDRFLDQYDMTVHKEAELVYFLTYFIGMLQCYGKL